MDNYSEQIEELRAEMQTLKENFGEFSIPGSPILPQQLDIQTEGVLEQKFSQHSALGRCHKTSAQSINDTTATKIVWEVNDFVNEMSWDATNNRFIIRRPGKYLITATTMYTSPATDGLYELIIYKNGSEYTRMGITCSSSSLVISPIIIDTISLLKDDYIEIFAFHNSGGAKSVAGSATLSYCSILRIN